jgi:peptide deformylase
MLQLFAMSRLEIRIYPDPILKQISSSVVKFDDDLKKLLDDMYETMISARGIGLAAPQVGISQQIAIVDVGEEAAERIDLLNPTIVWSSGSVPSEEGCLSIPEYRDTIKRSKEIVVQYKDPTGKEAEIRADGLLAICMQHEIDHLNGILFIDKLSRLKRELFKRWYKKNLAKE